MSLNNIKLTSHLTADLYKHSLIEPGEKNIAERFRFLGSNKKNILIIVHKPDVPFIEDNELQFLSTVLAACKLNIADIAVLNNTTIKEGNSYTALLEYFSS